MGCVLITGYRVKMSGEVMRRDYLCKGSVVAVMRVQSQMVGYAIASLGPYSEKFNGRRSLSED
jgi:hypothetical protein